MNPYVLIGAVLVAAGCYAYGRYDGVRITQAAQARAHQVAQLQSDKTTAAVVDAISKLRPVFTTINRPLEKEIRSEVRYTSPDCSLTPPVWGLLDRAYQAAGGEPLGGGVGVPTPTSAAGSDAR